MLLKITTLIFSFSMIAHADVFDSLKTWEDWKGTWKLRGRAYCAKELYFEDLLLGRFAEDLVWEFKDQNTVVEKFNVKERIKGQVVKECHTEITYDVQFLSKTDPAPGPAFTRKMRFTRTKAESDCLAASFRAETFVLGFISYQNFFESQEFIESKDAACPAGDLIIMQFNRQ